MAESFLAEVDAANNQQDEEVKQQEEEVQKPQKPNACLKVSGFGEVKSTWF